MNEEKKITERSRKLSGEEKENEKRRKVIDRAADNSKRKKMSHKIYFTNQIYMYFLIKL